MADDKQTTPAITPGGGSSSTMTQPPPRYLSAQEQQQILAQLGLTGWSMSPAALPDVELTQDLGKPKLASKGSYTVTIVDPRNPTAGGQKITIRPDDTSNPGTTTWLAESPAPKTTAPNKDLAITIKGKGTYYPDDINNPGGTYHQILPPDVPNADDEMTKALDREQQEQLRLQRQNNEKYGFGYVDDDTLHKRTIEARTLNLRADEIRARYAENDEKARESDKVQERENNLARSRIGVETAQGGLYGAQAGLAGANTSEVQQRVEQSAQQFPTVQAQGRATLAGTEANTRSVEQATQIAGAPKVEQPQQGMYQWQLDPKTGQVRQAGINPEYVPKTAAEVAARVGQISSIAQAKGAEIQRRVDSKEITPEQGHSEYQTWWQQTIAPQEGIIQAAQQKAQFDQAKDYAEMQRSAYQTALGAGTLDVNAFTAGQAGRVGPNWQQASEAASRGDWKGAAIPGATEYTATPPQETAHAAVMEALKHISPTAAQATGMPVPNYQGIDIKSAFDPTRYMPGGAPPPPAAVAAVNATGGAPDPNTWYEELRKRQAADAALQKVQAGIPGGPPMNAVPGQNYGAATAYTGGIAPWNFTPDMLPTYVPGG